MPRKMFLTLQDPTTDKTTSSFLKSVLTGLSRFVLGVDLFKSVWKSTPEASQAIAAGTGQNVDQLRAMLAASGINPDRYFEQLNELPDNIDSYSAADLNGELNKAQAAATDNSQTMWLIAAAVLLISLFMGRKSIGRAYRAGHSRYKAWRSRPRRSRGRRRR